MPPVPPTVGSWKRATSSAPAARSSAGAVRSGWRGAGHGWDLPKRGGGSTRAEYRNRDHSQRPTDDGHPSQLDGRPRPTAMRRFTGPRERLAAHPELGGQDRLRRLDLGDRRLRPSSPGCAYRRAPARPPRPPRPMPGAPCLAIPRRHLDRCTPGAPAGGRRRTPRATRPRRPAAPARGCRRRRARPAPARAAPVGSRRGRRS